MLSLNGLWSSLMCEEPLFTAGNHEYPIVSHLAAPGPALMRLKLWSSGLQHSAAVVLTQGEDLGLVLSGEIKSQGFLAQRKLENSFSQF